MNFQGANVIITGGSSGIGKATAKMLAKQGANVFIIARDQKRLDQALQEIEAEGVSPDQQFGAFSADVRSYEEVEAVVAAIVETGGLPDGLINSAGITYPGYFEEIPLEVFHDLMDTNYFGTLHAIRAVLPLLKKNGGGFIVNISSGAGIVSYFGYTGYAAAKFAVRGLSDALRDELKPQGISVSVVFPPDTDTPQYRFEQKLLPPETRAISGTVKPLSPEQVAREILQGICRGKYLIMPGFKSELMLRFFSIFGSLTNWAKDHVIAKDRIGQLLLKVLS
ncbi:MAG: SDR family oxidoreductase [Chloroflexota bacterium]|nr:SDR family oxidoreductase [Chloroflexota bacterium]